MRFLTFLAALCFAASAHAQLVVKAGADGVVFSPQPLGLASPILSGTVTGTYTLGGTPTITGAALTTTTINGLTVTASTGTLTIPNSASLITAGAYSLTLTATATTAVTLPTTGTLATLAGAETLSNKTLTTPVIGAATGTSLAATGAITSSSPSAKIGYTTGAGGAVTQGTSRTTTVVMVPNPCTSGAITTTADSIAALGLATFTVTDSAVAATDVVVLSKTAGDVDTFAWVNTVGAGSFTVTLRNSHATDADTTAFVLNFAVIKAVAN